MTQQITIDDIITQLFETKKSKQIISKIPTGWNDGFSKEIISNTISFEGYDYIGRQCLKSSKEYSKFIEYNPDMDPDYKLLRKNLENIENLPYFIKWTI